MAGEKEEFSDLKGHKQGRKANGFKVRFFKDGGVEKKMETKKYVCVEAPLSLLPFRLSLEILIKSKKIVEIEIHSNQVMKKNSEKLNIFMWHFIFVEVKKLSSNIKFHNVMRLLRRGERKEEREEG